VAESIVPDPRRPTAEAAGPPAPRADPTRDLAGALHEVSNALTVVLGWIERARGAPPGEVDRALDIAAARASHARAIVRAAIVDDGGLTRSQATVTAVVRDAVTGMEPELRRAAIVAEEGVSPAVADLVIDHAPTVLQVLTNLLLNAIALSPLGARLRVEASSHGEGVVFAVVDQGPGIPPERRANLFQAGTSTRQGGAGIGLRHAAALAEALGGTLALGAQPVQGARFELTWPLASAPPPPESGAHPALHLAAPAPTPSRSRGMVLSGTRILLVEDDDAVVDLLDTALTARGADVVSVRHRGELAEALSTGRFDAALFDISPIQEDVRGAVALARGTRDETDALRVVLISGSAAQMPEMPADWVSAWVRKPFEIGEILQAIKPAEER
jgi:CheY-like chemotaxis protein